MALSKLIAQAKNKIVPKYTHRLKVWSIGSSTPEELLVDTVFEGKKPGFYGDYVQPLLGTIRALSTTKRRIRLIQENPELLALHRNKMLKYDLKKRIRDRFIAKQEARLGKPGAMFNKMRYFQGGNL